MPPPVAGRPAVVVLDGEQRSALAVVRSLGRGGYPVHVGSSVRGALAAGSRFCTSEVLLPDPGRESSAFVAAVARLVKERQARVVLPVTDTSILAVLEHRGLFAGARVPMADLERFLLASDKEATLQIAARLGIAVPPQWMLGEPGCPVPDIPHEQFPVVLKPSRSVAIEGGRRIKQGVSYAASPGDLASQLDRLSAAAFPLLVQARIVGPGIGIFLLRWEGTVRAVFAHRRIREFPPSGGVSVLATSIEAPASLVRKAEALLAALEWSGVAMVEFKQEARTGRHYLMEVNPRFWGSLQLAIDAGVDFPRYLVQLALGEPIVPVTQWQVGVTSRWGWGEIDHLLARLRHSRRAQLPPEAPGILRVILEAVPVWRPRQRGSVFRLTDPKPFLRETVAWFKALRE